MSKIDELINKLCPNGVEYKKLKEAVVMQRGTSITKSKSVLGKIPVISGGKEPSFYCDSSNRNGETITVSSSGAGAGYVRYWNEPIFVNDAFSVKGKEFVKTKYVYYCLSNIQQQIYNTKKGGGVPHVHISDIENFEIPVPPLEVQEEIVAILDRFDGLCNDICKGLPAEIKARQEQYEYYRDKLLDFKNVESKSIGSLITRITDKGKDFKNINQVYVVSNLKGMVKAEEYRENTIHSEDTSNYIVVQPGMFAYNPSRLNIGSIAMLKDNLPGLVSPMYVVFSIDENKIIKEYLEYNIKSSFVKNKINSLKEEGARFRFDFDRWNYINVPVPPIEEQKRIVNILDKFTELIAELTAELTARRKQYEYYRDKLLTFKKLA